MESDLGNIFLSSGLTAGGIGSIIWYFIKRLIARIDALEKALNSTDPNSPGLITMMALNDERDQNFREQFKTHIETHTGIREEVRDMLEKFKKDLFEDMDRRYKQK